ncbi:SPP1 family predicted phage head-tail adaptor [Tepidamorphus gemmatus]|uniref:SPP1 family predicted phage head-tail adaptor n=1 Tax=Tepidamorphus gemmatus TaxID=747076 RepID=A0A4R3LTE3_9HYPH|nr:phage head closure protein [Tepidamorphus gemmatus]TCT02819.1 SPP1 family predicted phage head-tail adaptor [Tepidamorphus gemmatus]
MAVIAQLRLASLRHRVRLQAPAAADDGAGGHATTWSDVATLWAAIVPAGPGSTAERVEAGRLEAAARLRITIRYRTGLTHDMRFALSDRVFAITGIADPDGRGRHLVCDCEEIVP